MNYGKGSSKNFIIIANVKLQTSTTISSNTSRRTPAVINVQLMFLNHSFELRGFYVLFFLNLITLQTFTGFEWPASGWNINDLMMEKPDRIQQNSFYFF